MAESIVSFCAKLLLMHYPLQVLFSPFVKDHKKILCDRLHSRFDVKLLYNKKRGMVTVHLNGGIAKRPTRNKQSTPRFIGYRNSKEGS